MRPSWRGRDPSRRAGPSQDRPPGSPPPRVRARESRSLGGPPPARVAATTLAAASCARTRLGPGRPGIHAFFTIVPSPLHRLLGGFSRAPTPRRTIGMKVSLLSLAGAASLALLTGGVAWTDAVKVDPQIPAYTPVSGVSGTVKSAGSETMTNLMTLWAEGF